MTNVFGALVLVLPVLLLKEGWYFFGRMHWSGFFRHRVSRERMHELQQDFHERGGRLPPTPTSAALVVIDSWSLVLSLVGLAISALLAR